MQNHEKTLKDAMWMMREINWKWNDDKIVILQDLSNIKNFWKENNGPVDEHKKSAFKRKYRAGLNKEEQICIMSKVCWTLENHSHWVCALKEKCLL